MGAKSKGWRSHENNITIMTPLKLTLAELMGSKNETVRRNAMSIFKTLQKIEIENVCKLCGKSKPEKWNGYCMECEHQN